MVSPPLRATAPRVPDAGWTNAPAALSVKCSGSDEKLSTEENVWNPLESKPLVQTDRFTEDVRFAKMLRLPVSARQCRPSCSTGGAGDGPIRSRPPATSK